MSYWHSWSSQAWRDWFYFLCVIWGFSGGMCVDNMRMLPGLCQHFQCSCSVNGWAVNCRHSNGQTWPDGWRTAANLSKRNMCACVCIFRCVQSPPLTPCSLVPENWAAVWTEGQCQILLFSSTSEGFGGASFGTSLLFRVQNPAFSQYHWPNLIKRGWASPGRWESLI